MKKLIVVALCCAVAGGAFAKSQGFQASLTPDIATHDRNTQIEGVSIGIWNENPSPNFQWQLGFVNGSTGDSVGVQGPFFALLNYAENYTGAQLGFINYAEKMTGLQWGFINYAKTADTCVQIGLINLMGETTEWFKEFPSEVAPGMIFVNWRFK